VSAVIHIVCDFFQRKVSGRPDKTHEVLCKLPAYGYYQRLKDGKVLARCAKHNPNLLGQIESDNHEWLRDITQEEYVVGKIMQS